MSDSCQGLSGHARDEQPVVAVAGVAGSGKTTLGRALALRLGAPVLDLDSLTNPLLDRLDDLFGGAHWNGPGSHRAAVREGRYAAMRSVAADLVSVGLRPVLVAPFTSELIGGPEWRELLEAVAPAQLVMVHIDGPAELFARRRAARGLTRDACRPADPEMTPPRIPHVRVDADLVTDRQVALVLGELRPDGP